MVIPWIASQTFAHQAQSLLVHVGRRRGKDDGAEKKPLSYSPWDGRFFFFHKNHLLWFRSTEKDMGFRRKEVISVSCFGRSPAILKELFDECRSEYLKSMENKTPIFENRDGKWRRMKAGNIRPISTVIMNEEEKTELLEDIKSFFAPRSRAWYSARGIPYRKGYLLYGPPGTGKSSLCLSIAGHFDQEIYVLNVSDVDAKSLGALFADLPPSCVLLLEDVDAVGVTQSRQAQTETSQVKPSLAEAAKSKLSLSDLLNAFDGVSPHEGRLLLMTTNHIELLDVALIRPGRADKKVELRNADRDMTRRLFCLVFKQLKDDISDLEKPAEDDETVNRLANEFAHKVPELEFSPAEIQSFLVEHRHSLDKAMEKMKDWMIRVREERKKVKRAGSWVFQE